MKENEQVSGRIEEEIRAAMNIPLARAAAGEDGGAAAGKTPVPAEGAGSAPDPAGRTPAVKAGNGKAAVQKAAPASQSGAKQKPVAA